MVVDLCNELSKDKNSDIYLCVFNENGELHSFKKDLGNNVHYVNFHKRFKWDIGLQWRIFWFFRNLKPDVVNSHLSGTVLYVYLPVLMLRRVRFYHTIHNLAQEEVPSGFFRKIRFLIYKTKRLHPVSISRITQASHAELYGIDSKLIYNGVQERGKTGQFQSVRSEISSYRKNDDTKVFLSVGRINSAKDQKNYKLLVEVFARLSQEGKNVLLLIIGADNSAHQTTLNALLKIKTDNVRFLGPKNNVSDYMLNADFYCLSSKFEGLPITVIEALSHGLPVVATAVGGIPELISNSENGLLVKSVDPEDFYNAIAEMLTWDKNKREQVATANFRKYTENFSIAIAARNYGEYYRGNLTKSGADD